MLRPRMATVLTSIARQYISNAVPVSSASIVGDCGLEVSSATIRNEMARLEDDGYIIRPHHAAGSIPSDKGYLYYAGTVKNLELPLAEQRLINHLFHQVEDDLEEWLSLAVELIAQRVQNVAVVTTPKPIACQFKHVELVSLQDYLALVVLVLHGAKVRQQLINFEQAITQEKLTDISSKLNAAYTGLTGPRILAKDIELSPTEQQIIDCLLRIMNTEDKRAYEEPYLDGFHFWLNQPEFSTGQRMAPLVELFEQRKLVEAILPDEMEGHSVKVIIGKDNKAEVIQGCSVVISRYGLPDEAVGTIGVIGPTRMPYARAISTIGYLASIMSTLVAELYGKELPRSDRQAGNEQQAEE
ncbi:MAG: heat-inducible transcriptional repressor HrcA [Dehalococcoidales bacterium]|nr:heat-inducible transcriptional repressor HrcA [Dehalococcoidales bacterium]